MIEVKISFETVAEMVNFFSKPSQLPIAVHTDAPAEADVGRGEVAAAPEPTPEPTPEPKKRMGRPPKKTESEAPAAREGGGSLRAEPAAPAASDPEPTTFTLDDVRQAAQQVVEKLGAEVGMTQARKVLMEHADTKVIRDVKPEQCEAVTKALRELLK